MKELIQLLNRNKKLIPLLLGILLLPFNKVIFTGYPSYFLGKFNFFQTNNILASEIIILLGCLLILFGKLISLNIKKINFIPYLFFVWILILTPNFHILIALALLITILQLNKEEKKLLAYGFFITVGFQSIWGLLQAGFQSDLGLQIIGEPKINESTKGVAKIRLADFTIFRSYGSLPHANILGAYLSLAVLNLPSSFKYASSIFYLGLLSTFSLTATYVNTIVETIKVVFAKKKRIFFALILSILTTIAVTGVRLYETKPESFTSRIEQIEQTIDYKPNIKEVLTGYNNQTVNQKKKPWDITPTHNVYLLTQETYGLIGLLLLLLMLAYSLKVNPANAIFLGLMFLTDHFWLTLPHGLILLVLALVLFQKNQDSQVENPKSA